MSELGTSSALEKRMQAVRNGVDTVLGFLALRGFLPPQALSGHHPEFARDAAPVLSAPDPCSPARDKISDLKDRVHWPFDNMVLLSKMFELAEKLNPDLESYDLIIGDDTSGRLPALLYWRLANARRQERGLEPASIRFINGRYTADKPLPGELIPPEHTDGSRSLIVTEYVMTGGSVENIYHIVSQQRDRRRIDIAALGSEMSRVATARGSNFYTAEPPIGGMRIDNYLYGHSFNPVKGVGKEYGVLHSHRLPPNEFRPNQVHNARQDINLIADEFYPLLSAELLEPSAPDPA